MKRLSLILVAVIILFSGCGNGDFRNVELTDIEYTYIKNTNNDNFIYLTALVSAENFEFEYLALDSEKNVIDTFTREVGKVISARTYRINIDSWSRDVFWENVATVEIISVAGKVNKNDKPIMRDVEIAEINYSGAMFTDENLTKSFIIKPTVSITNLNVKFGLYTEENTYLWTLEKSVGDVIAGAEYTIEVPDYSLNGHRVAKVTIISATGKVKN